MLLINEALDVGKLASSKVNHSHFCPPPHSCTIYRAGKSPLTTIDLALAHRQCGAILLHDAAPLSQVGPWRRKLDDARWQQRDLLNLDELAWVRTYYISRGINIDLVSTYSGVN